MTQNIAISGARGLVGDALTTALQKSGHKVVPMVRTSSGNATEILWDIQRGIVNPDRLKGIDTVIHLAGENIASGRWNAAIKEKIRNSRVQGTRSLVNSLRDSEARPSTLVCASAVGFYGHRGDELLNESSPAGSGFLADVCREWEAEAMKAEELGIRVVCVRIGVVLSRKGGALAKMLLPFKLGAGGIVGNGRQYWSWIGLTDLVRILQFCAETPTVKGPVNAVSPEAATNYQFTKALGSVLHRPTIFPLPAFMAKLVLGEMADELLLASIRAQPAALQNAGFKFATPELKQCLELELR
ncbi:MAG: TIGR01777 family oxidoreductase [Planctomycetaceae bacterium]|nr:TIGR01777 family oxidoreductase [Planctomycetaceae bacterium]